MATSTTNQQLTPSKTQVEDNRRAGAEVIHGGEECYRHSVELLEELGFPKGVLPLKNLVECGRVRDTGFVWMKSAPPYEHYFKKTGTKVSYATEVTAYVEPQRMKRMTGIKSKQMFMWVPIVEMVLEESREKINFKTPMGTVPPSSTTTMTAAPPSRIFEAAPFIYYYDYAVNLYNSSFVS